MKKKIHDTIRKALLMCGFLLLTVFATLFLNTTEAFAKEGAKVLLVGRRESVLQEACEKNENICYVAADITKTEDVAKVAEYVKDIINEKAGSMQVKRKSCIDKYSYFIITRIKDVIKNHVSQQNKLFRLVRNLYRKFK
jgi:hypothetical protein